MRSEHLSGSKVLELVEIIVCHCMDTRATGMDGQKGILAGLDQS